MERGPGLPDAGRSRSSFPPTEPSCSISASRREQMPDALGMFRVSLRVFTQRRALASPVPLGKLLGQRRKRIGLRIRVEHRGSSPALRRRASDRDASVITSCHKSMRRVALTRSPERPAAPACCLPAAVSLICNTRAALGVGQMLKMPCARTSRSIGSMPLSRLLQAELGLGPHRRLAWPRLMAQ